MKRFFTTILLIGECILLLSSCAKKITTKGEEHSNENRKFCPETDKLPEFPGGDECLVEFIRSTVRYPESAAKNNIEGRVVVGVVINTDGSISDVKVVEKVEYYLDREAKRVIKKMPKWIPGERNNEKVRTYYTIPIVFKLR